MWKDDLNEDIKSAPAFKDIGDDINDLAKNFLDVQSHLGNAIRIPSAEASEEDVTAFHSRLKEKVPGLIRQRIGNREQAVTQPDFNRHAMDGGHPVNGAFHFAARTR